MNNGFLTAWNAIITDGELPIALTRSKIVPVKKPGKKPERVEIYRRIARLACAISCYRDLLTTEYSSFSMSPSWTNWF